MRAFTDCWAPRPSATTAITAPTPMTTPSIVRNERSLLARNAPSATPMVSPSSMSASLRYLLGSGAGRSPAATTAPPSATARTASTSASGRGLLLLQSTSGPGSHTRLELFTLRLQHGRPQQRDLLALLQTAKNFGVIEVADT